MFIINLTYIMPLEYIDRIMASHLEFLDTQYKQGIFLMSGRKQPRSGGIILAKAGSREQIEQIMSNDPFVVHQAVKLEIIEFMPTKYAEFLSDIQHEF